jgi:hypothetical protein
VLKGAALQRETRNAANIASLTQGGFMDMSLPTLSALYPAVETPRQSAYADLPAPAPLPKSSLKRLRESEGDAFAYFQTNFAQLPWHRRGRPGIRKA